VDLEVLYFFLVYDIMVLNVWFRKCRE